MPSFLLWIAKRPLWSLAPSRSFASKSIAKPSGLASLKKAPVSKPASESSPVSYESQLELAETGSVIMTPSSPSDVASPDGGRVDAISGAPSEMTKRFVRIYKPSRTAMQSGNEQTRQWELDFDVQPKWENPLMGWTSSADPVQGLQLSFDTAEEAVAFAKKQGWNVRVDAPHESIFRKKTYAENFLYSKGPHRIYRTK